MQIIGRSRMDSFFFFFFVSVASPLCPSFLFRVAKRTLIAAWQTRQMKGRKRLGCKGKNQNILLSLFFWEVDLRPELTIGAPSISSIIRQFGFSLTPRTDFICVAVSMRFWNTSALRSSLWKHQKSRRCPIRRIVVITAAYKLVQLTWH